MSEAPDVARDVFLAVIGHEDAPRPLPDCWRLQHIAAFLDGKTLDAVLRSCRAGRQWAMQVAAALPIITLRLQLGDTSVLSKQFAALDRVMHARGHKTLVVRLAAFDRPVHMWDVLLTGRFEAQIVALLHFMAFQAAQHNKQHPDSPTQLHLVLDVALTDNLVGTLVDCQLPLDNLTVGWLYTSDDHRDMEWAVKQLTVRHNVEPSGFSEVLFTAQMATLPATGKVVLHHLDLVLRDPEEEPVPWSWAESCLFDVGKIFLHNDLDTAVDNGDGIRAASLQRVLTLRTTQPLRVFLGNNWPLTPAMGQAVTAAVATAAATHPGVTFGLGSTHAVDGLERATVTLVDDTVDWLLDHAPGVTEVHVSNISGALSDYSHRTCSWTKVHSDDVNAVAIVKLPGPATPGQTIQVTCNSLLVTVSPDQIADGILSQAQAAHQHFRCTLCGEKAMAKLFVASDVPKKQHAKMLHGCLQLLRHWQCNVNLLVLNNWQFTTKAVARELVALPGWVTKVRLSGTMLKSGCAVKFGCTLARTNVRDLCLTGESEQEVVRMVCEGVAKHSVQEAWGGEVFRVRVSRSASWLKAVRKWVRLQGWKAYVEVVAEH